MSPIAYDSAGLSWRTVTSTTGPWYSFGQSVDQFRTSMAALTNRVGAITEEHKMNTAVTEVEGITGLSAGTKVLVRQEGADEPVVWVADGDNGFTNDGARLTASAFMSAIANGNVFLQGRYAVGDTFAAGAYYYKILDVEGDGWVMGKTNSTAAVRHSSIVHGQPPMETGAFPTPPRDHTAVYDLLAQVWEGQKSVARLAQVIESGQVPVETTYTVTVEVQGEVDVTPTNAQVKRMMGDNDATIIDLSPTHVLFTKTMEVERTALWGCACDQVTADNLDGVDAFTSWRVTGCTPVEGESTVHVA